MPISAWNLSGEKITAGEDDGECDGGKEYPAAGLAEGFPVGLVE